MAAAPPKLRILALHGFASNAFHFNKRLGSFRKATAAVADLHFLNAPHLVQPVSVTLGLEARDDLVDENTPLEEQPRAWWRANGPGQSQYDGWPETLAFINDALKEHGPFDAVLGFSQGGCLAGVLVSAFEDPSRLPGLVLPEGQKPFKFAINVSGFRAADERMKACFPPAGISTPVLHVLGRNDQIVDEERAQTLVAAFKSTSRVEHHDGGHALPTQAPWRQFFKAFFEHFAASDYAPSDAWREVAPPSARPFGKEPDSAPGSGTVTPRDDGRHDNKSSL